MKDNNKTLPTLAKNLIATGRAKNRIFQVFGLGLLALFSLLYAASSQKPCLLCNDHKENPENPKNLLAASPTFPGDEIDLKAGSREKLMHAIDTCAAQIQACRTDSSTSTPPETLEQICIHSPGTREHYDRISQGCRAQQFTWNRHCHQSNHSGLIVIATEQAETTPYWDYCGCKILIGMEPLAIKPRIKDVTQQYYNQATIILSAFHPEYDPDGKFIPFTYGSTFVSDQERKVYSKKKGISIIASAKSTASGHILRHTLIEKYALDWGIDVYGRGYNPVDRKVEALQEYRYTVVIENSQEDYYITEKLIDSFLTGTIPIYWGSKSALNLFNPDGILYFNDEEEFEAAMMLATPAFYRKRWAEISENYELALKFSCPEDRLFKNIFGPLRAALSKDKEVGMN